MANPLITNYDTSKILLGNNEFNTADVTASGADVVFSAGDVLGQIAATAKLVLLDNTATDGSQYPFGVIYQDQTIADGVTATVSVVNKGKINKNLLTFGGSTTLASTVGAASNLKTIDAELNGLGLTLKAGVEMSGLDNQ
jgi:hypothetical protein